MCDEDLFFSDTLETPEKNTDLYDEMLSSSGETDGSEIRRKNSRVSIIKREVSRQTRGINNQTRGITFSNARYHPKQGSIML